MTSPNRKRWETSTFDGVSRNTDSATFSIDPPTAYVRPEQKSIMRRARSFSLACRLTMTGELALTMSPISCASEKRAGATTWGLVWRWVTNGRTTAARATGVDGSRPSSRAIERTMATPARGGAGSGYELCRTRLAAVYRGLTGQRSVHLKAWPDADELPSDPGLVEAMDLAREVCSAGHPVPQAPAR